MANHVIRWLHLSDFHVGKDDDAEIFMFDRIIKRVKEKKQEGWNPDFVFITGDVANKGKKAEYEKFYLEFLAPLQELLGGEIDRRTFAVPGNHDVDISINQPFDRQEMADPNKPYFDADENGLQHRAILLPRFKAFAENDFSAPGGAWINSPDGVFRALEVVNGIKVGIIGINTAWLSKGEHEREKLTPGSNLLERSYTHLKDCQLRFVVGHHPLDWLFPKESRKIKSLLGQASAVYLHGHLHDAWSEPGYGGGYNFLTVQSGAAFQARDDEKWRNGIVFGEADIENKILRLQPWVWKDDFKGWVLEADAFPDQHRRNDWWEYTLPGEQPRYNVGSRLQSEIAPPTGWTVSTLDILREYNAPLDSDLAVQFFNGASPIWRVALSSSTPRRNVTKSLVKHFANPDHDRPPQVVLLLGASCEGKTTALLQAAYGVLEQNRSWKILRRTDETKPVDPSQLMPLLSSGGEWLVVIDEADRAAQGVVQLLQQAPAPLRGKLHFLLACRESDWFSSGANDLMQSAIDALQTERLTGLEEEEAKDIIHAWEQFGDKGLGKLSTISEDARVGQLLDAARLEAKVTKGAFFGALLAVRFGDDLKKHAGEMLKRLAQREIPGGSTLLKALTFIAAMHAEQLEFLSRPVLAFALGCPVTSLQSKVIKSLSAEAASTVTSDFVFTRHLRIAKAIMKVAVEDFDEDNESLYVKLAEAAIDALEANTYLPENPSKWRHTLPEHFFDSNRQSLGIKIAEALFRREETDYRRAVELAKFYRKAGAAEQAVRLFYDFKHDVARGFFYEWGTSEGNAGDYACDVLLSAYSLADQCDSERLSRQQSKLSLTGLCEAFGELHDIYLNRVFADGRAAAAVAAITILGRELRNDPKADYFQRCLSENDPSGASIPRPKDAVAQIHKAILTASDYVRSDVVKERIGDVRNLTFTEFDELIRVTDHRTKPIKR